MKYKTKQRQAILHALRTAGRHITIAELIELCQAQGQSIGATTAYRQMEELMREGMAQKFIIDESSPACYAYLDETDDQRSIHCKCQKCGRLLHIQCPEFEAMERHIFGAHDFQLDPRRTVLYGTCQDCRAKAAEEAGPEAPAQP